MINEYRCRAMYCLASRAGRESSYRSIVAPAFTRPNDQYSESPHRPAPRDTRATGSPGRGWDGGSWQLEP